ncbi:uncharacterized protein VP01_13727g1, partial [Puccinia sorghi]
IRGKIGESSFKITKRQNIHSLFPCCSVQRAVKRERLLLGIKKDNHQSRTLNARLDELMHMMGACLKATAGLQNPSPAQPNPVPVSNPIVIAKTQPFDGTHGTTAKAFIGQIGLHAVTYPKQFPTNASK